VYVATPDLQHCDLFVFGLQGVSLFANQFMIIKVNGLPVLFFPVGIIT
jgi:hypothetical protein